MPVHDWSRVTAGIFHHFHGSWITEISNALNDGVLPADYYTLSEQVVGPSVPDVLTLKAAGTREEPGTGAVAVETAPPRVRFTVKAEQESQAQRRRVLAIRLSSGDRVVAWIEIVSAGNKSSQAALEQFLGKAAEALGQGQNLLLVELQRPTERDAQGLHGALWGWLGATPDEAPADKALTLAAYVAEPVVTAYVEPVAVGDPLVDMPLFLNPDFYVNVPLDATYQAAWRGVPRRWKDVLEVVGQG